MEALRKKPDKPVKQLLDALRSDYLPSHPEARIDAYRYNAASIRIRVIDPGFSGKTMAEREDELWAILDRLPQETRADIHVLLLLSPQETETSLINLEFEDPTPTRL
jgi:hypothetical protein